MAVFFDPFYLPNSSYRPNYFVTYQPSANPLVLAKAQVYVNGSLVTELQKPPAYSTGVAPTFYYFEFDVSKILQTLSAPNPNNISQCFPKFLNAQYTNIAVNDNRKFYYLYITYYYRDPVTNNLTLLTTGAPPVAVSDTTTTAYAVIGTRQTLDFMGMDAYSIDYPTVGGVYEKYFLTNLPSVYPTSISKTNNPILICSADNHNLTFIPTSGTNTLRIIIYDASQNVVGAPYFLNITPNTTFRPVTFGIGPIQLNPIIPGIINLQIGYHYSIDAGNFIGSTYTLQSRKYMFKIVDCCANKIRLHWLNRLGGADAYSFTNKKTVFESTKSDIAQKPQSYNYANTPPTNSYDKGSFKIQQVVNKSYEVESIFYDAFWGQWIAELLSSPEVYMETPSGLVAVIIEDSQIKIEETNELVNVTLTVVESNEISVQQN
jgi:hypothetical protein